VKLDSDSFLDNASEALGKAAQVERRSSLGTALPLARNIAMDELGNFEQARDYLKSVRDHTLDNLEHYLLEFEKQAVENGSQVHFATNADDMNSVVLDICQRHGARKVIKGKSMVTEETGLNDFLHSVGLDVQETDLGEYIIQQAGETPSHIVGPALHKSIDEIGELFREKHDLGDRPLETAEEMVAEARTILREHFLSADVGIIGANALIAENGYSMLVTNEGNGDLCVNLPNVLIICTTMERILPRAEDAAALMRLLARSATGQAITSYTSFYSGPRRADEAEGPLETHIVLLDNRRSDILASDYREMLQCIRCGACLNHCPIYIGVGGQAYGWVYPGPMGSVLTPLLTSLEQSKALPDACTSCGRCEEVCPAGIPLPDLLRKLRQVENNKKINSPRLRLGLQVHTFIATRPRLYRTLSHISIRLLHLLGRKKGALGRLPFASGWTSQRDFPAPQADTFMRQYREKRKQHEH
jgi:L-lactate dehydrogenase complex protein LldF